MRDSDGTDLNRPAADVGPPKSGWSRRLSAVAALLLVGLIAALIAVAVPAAGASSQIVTPGTDVPPIGRWVSGGAEVDIPAFFGPTTKWYSDRENEPVEVDCVAGVLQAKVRGYFGSGDGMVAGWTSAKNIRTGGWTAPLCGFLDYAAFTS